MNTNETLLLTIEDDALDAIVGGEGDGSVEPVWPIVCQQMSDRGEWASPGCGDLGQFL